MTEHATSSSESSAARRPRIAILGRFAETTSATRYSALVSARRLLELVWAAGGEPITFLPVADETDGANWAARLEGIDGVLMPGGGDIAPSAYGQTPETEHLYGIDSLQDATDMSIVRWAFANGVPVLAICRGMQVTNVALGGSLKQHMDAPHLYRDETLSLLSDGDTLGCGTGPIAISCYHHQEVATTGEGVEVIARSASGNVEALRFPSQGWAYGVQWHPEDNYDAEPAQLGIALRFIDEARKH